MDKNFLKHISFPLLTYYNSTPHYVYKSQQYFHYSNEIYNIFGTILYYGYIYLNV